MLFEGETGEGHWEGLAAMGWESLEGILRALGAGGILFGQEGAIRWISPGLSEWWGLEPAQWLGHPMEALKAHPELGPWLAPMLDSDGALPEGPLYGEVRGRWFRAVRSGFSRRFQGGALLGVVELTLEKRRLEHLERAAHRDELTGLSNRRCFRERLRAAVQGASRHGFPVTLAYLDLDDFKKVNDRLGHIAGDGVLRDVGQVLTGCVRRTDTVARLGGEGFVALFPHMEPEMGRRKAEALRKALIREGLPGPEGPDGPLTMSIGVAGGHLPGVRPGGDDLENRLMSAADHALYAAKAAGKNRVRLGSLAAEEAGPAGA
ncbi:GGDEF domain-containing protein [Thiohalorhabdus sp. Cl-TMA]|uniref:diguanylate cyclase n=1 Tax=Thiohalorhabdus methylotrophus TaxID=3242694 RepID=A0ABV4TWU2_9GAMM